MVEKYSRQIKRKHNLGFDILQDAGNTIAADFGLRWSLPDYPIETYKDIGVDLERFNGDDSWTLPMPAGYVIDRDGVILRAEFDTDYTHRPEPAETLSFLREFISKN